MLIAAARAILVGRGDARVLDRRLEGELVFRALAITAVALLGIAGTLLLLARPAVSTTAARSPLGRLHVG